MAPKRMSLVKMARYLYLATPRPSHDGGTKALMKLRELLLNSQRAKSNKHGSAGRFRGLAFISMAWFGVG